MHPTWSEDEPVNPTARADVRPCPQCRQAFPTRRSLRRHASMDHRPAPDGAQLTARLVGATEPDRQPRAVGEPAGSVRLAEPPPQQARQEPTRPAGSPAPPAWPFLVVLLLVAVLAGPLLAAALWVSALTVALWWRYDRTGRERRGPGRSR
jgi:hypothetical protein